jgi:hypothetical protein
VQGNVCQSDAYKNPTDGLAKLVAQQKSDKFWLFCVNEGLETSGDQSSYLYLNVGHFINTSVN